MKIAKPKTPGHIPEYRLALVRETPPPPGSFDVPPACIDFWHAAVAPDFDPEKEHLVVLLLNTKLRLKGHTLVSMGSLSETIAHPRDILRPVIYCAAWGFILMHNHPSGDPSPSDADRRLTLRIGEAARLMQIQFLDHLVVGARDACPGYFSFREAGVL